MTQISRYGRAYSGHFAQVTIDHLCQMQVAPFRLLPASERDNVVQLLVAASERIAALHICCCQVEYASVGSKSIAAHSDRASRLHMLQENPQNVLRLY